MQNSYIERVKINGEYHDFVCGDIKTVNGESLLGEGNIIIAGGSTTPTTLWSGDTVMASGTSNTTINIPAECSSYKMLFIKIFIESREYCMYLPKVNNSSIEGGLSETADGFLSVVWNISNSSLTSKFSYGSKQAVMKAIYGV